MEHFYPQIQVKTKKKFFNKNRSLFFSTFTLRCTPIQIIGGDADADHSQTIGYRKFNLKLDGSLPANPVNDRRVANAVTLKSNNFCLPSIKNI